MGEGEEGADANGDAEEGAAGGKGKEEVPAGPTAAEIVAANVDTTPEVCYFREGQYMEGSDESKIRPEIT